MGLHLLLLTWAAVVSPVAAWGGTLRLRYRRWGPSVRVIPWFQGVPPPLVRAVRRRHWQHIVCWFELRYQLESDFHAAYEWQSPLIVCFQEPHLAVNKIENDLGYIRPEFIKNIYHDRNLKCFYHSYIILQVVITQQWFIMISLEVPIAMVLISNCKKWCNDHKIWKLKCF